MEGFNKNGEIILNINGKDVRVRDLVDTLNKIKKVCLGVCEYCEREGIRTDKDKLNLILKLVEGVGL